MPKYEIIYSPKSPALNAEMETEVEADQYEIEGRFVTSYKNDELYKNDVLSMGVRVGRSSRAPDQDGRVTSMWAGVRK